MAFGKKVGGALFDPGVFREPQLLASSCLGVAKRQGAEMLRFSSFKFVSVVSDKLQNSFKIQLQNRC